MSSFYKTIIAVLQSSKFFVVIMLVFFLQSTYIAFTAAYPMVFDENTHFGVIQLHASQLNPVFTSQPVNAEFAGALTRDPSYLHRYLLSLPYELISKASDSAMMQVISLRVINITLFGLGLVLFRRLLLKTGAHRAIIHSVLFLFILIPVVPLLAGQINYDNMVFPATALLLLLALRIISSVQKRVLPVGAALLYMTVGMLGCLVQFAFLPIFAGSFLWLAWLVFRAIRSRDIKPGHDLRFFWTSHDWMKRTLYIVPFVLACILFFQMYGVNVVKYHNLVPQCHQVLDKESCALNGAWNRNYQARLSNDGSANTNPVLYGAGWAYRMFVSSFYTSSGGASPSAWYLSINPLPIPFYGAIILFIGGALLIVRYNLSLIHQYKHLGFLLFVAIFYCVALWARNYQDFVHLGEKVAINGRYILPVLLPVMLIVALAYYKLLARYRAVLIFLLLGCGLLFSQGGGAITYIVTSQSSWYWQSPAVTNTNKVIQRVVSPFVLLKNPIQSVE